MIVAVCLILLIKSIPRLLKMESLFRFSTVAVEKQKYRECLFSEWFQFFSVKSE